MKADDLYTGICNDLAELGIYLNKRDVHLLLYIILKNMKEVCRNTDRLYLSKYKKISASLVKGNIEINICDDYIPKSKTLRMTDKASNKIFNDIFLPSIVELLNSEED